ncbi:MAG: hypothetical protein Q4P18_08410 [Methanobrevibacter sp.]|uniref:hypothetical protein n=1 Tax=Methanobrevibacter sp. TaxID=66852 RepID=UPI0026E035CC|nr:hypothetical protein [Methanobrevibacter sp.]MDO5849545.1 hypothetical protein [Methanobrevibacter sp.]
MNENGKKQNEMNRNCIEAEKAGNEKLHELMEIHKVDRMSKELEEQVNLHEKEEQESIEELEHMIEYDYCEIDDTYEDSFGFSDWPDPIGTLEERKSQKRFDESIDWNAECFIYGYEGGLYKEEKDSL